jgi:hypothetical protein
MACHARRPTPLPYSLFPPLSFPFSPPHPTSQAALLVELYRCRSRRLQSTAVEEGGGKDDDEEEEEEQEDEEVD